MTYKIQRLNNISPRGLDRFPSADYETSTECKDPDAIILRSMNLHDAQFGANLKAVGRAGAGTNNIPLERLSEAGVAVFNAPGANANAVKELVIGGMLLAERNLADAVEYTRRLRSTGDTLTREVEDGKKKFVGRELPGRTLGVIGLGAIGVEVANAAAALGMEVVGYDPAITVASAWRLQAQVSKAGSVDELLGRSDFITFHVPLIDATRNMINAQRLSAMRDGAVVLNFARAGVVDETAILAGLDSGKLKAYLSDFPTEQSIAHPRAITFPHLGASTTEAEENCAIMVADQLRGYLEHGHVVNSVNFPAVQLHRESPHRVTVVHVNVPDMLGQISHALGRSSVNIVHMINESKGSLAYTVMDAEMPVGAETLALIEAIEGVLKVRPI